MVFYIKLRPLDLPIRRNYPPKLVQIVSVVESNEYANGRTDGNDRAMMLFIFAHMQVCKKNSNLLKKFAMFMSVTLPTGTKSNIFTSES